MSKKYNEIEVKDNMAVTDNNDEELATPTREKMQSVVSAKPTQVKRGLLGRFVTGIVGPEGLPGIGSYVNEEIVKPAIKNIIVDAVTSGINMVMYGEKGGNRGYRPGSGVRPSTYRPQTNYSSNYRQAPVEHDNRVASRPARGGVNEYVIDERIDASNVLVSLTDAADRYDTVSVADYYDLIGMPSVYTDNNIGWTFDTISRATIVPARGGGYLIKFPPVEVI